jgi:carbon monoxide dehydrogenase subunit G
MKATGSIVIDAPVERIWEFVLDPERYAQADTKILKAELTDRREGELVMRTTGYMRWRVFRGQNELRVTLRPHQQIDFDTVPGSLKFPATFLQERFHASFTFEQAPGGTRVTHIEEVVFKPNPTGRMLERLFSAWLTTHLRDVEMPRLKELVEAESGGRAAT